MKKSFSRLQSLQSNLILTTAFAAVALSSAPAVAQTMPGKATSSVAHPDMSAREFFGYKEYIRGIHRTEEQYQQLKDYGCTVSPTTFVPKIVEEAIAGGYMCSKKFFEKVGSKNTGGTVSEITYMGAGGATVVKSIKGNKVGQNYLEVSTYNLSPNSDGKPQSVTYNYHANGGQYMAQMLSSLPGTILGATLPQFAAAATREDCDEACRTGVVNMVTVGVSSSSIANAASQAIQNTQGTPTTPAPCASNSHSPCTRQ